MLRCCRELPQMLGGETVTRGCGEHGASLAVRPSLPSFAPALIHPNPDPSRPRAPTPPSQQATGITEDLYHRAYTFCTRLLTLPAPYSTVALDCAIRLKTEAAVPGERCWASPVWQCSTTQYQAAFSRMPKSSKPSGETFNLWAPSRRIGVRDPEAGSLM